MNELDFENIINSTDGLVIIDFSASWCMPCRMLKPIIERVADKMPEVDFYNIDVDENEDIAKKYRIFSVPTLVCFRDGKKVDTLVGLNSFDDIVAFIERCKEAEVNED